MNISQLTTRRPYLLRASYEWLLDNNLTPYLVVETNTPDIIIPIEYSYNSHIVLNIAPRAVNNLVLSNKEVSFSARFKGIPRQVVIPIMAILSIYAHENRAAATIFSGKRDDSNQVLLQNILDKKNQNDLIKNVMSSIDGNDMQDKKLNKDNSNYDNKCNKRSHSFGRPLLYVVK